MGLLRSKVRFVAEDREMAPDIAAARELIWRASWYTLWNR